MWLNIPDEDFGLVVGAVEQLRAAAVLMDVHDELRKGLDSLVSVLKDPRQQRLMKDPYRLIRAICEENDWEEGDDPGHRIWSIAHSNVDPDTVDAP